MSETETSNRGDIATRAALAMSMHAAPGTYAVLVGSGMSSAAGIPTGWQVVQDLIRRVAVCEGVERSALEPSPEAWWMAHGQGEPRYDTLLNTLASTESARQDLLRGYFDPPPGGGGPINPTAAHDALAALCARGSVRLILTTNFDRLLERALDGVGLTPQVLDTAGAITGMTPLIHAGATIIKLHGDYAKPNLRNTPEELSHYPEELDALLDRVFDEFGLLVVGWSAEYDVALVDAITRARSRRYPTFWAAHAGELAESGQRLVGLRSATVIKSSSADELLVDLQQRLERLDEVARRRERPTILRTYAFAPEATTAPQGWAVLPLLQVRAAAVVVPASLDTVGLIRPEQRESLQRELRLSPVAAAIRALAAVPAISAAVDVPPTAGALALADWHPTPGGHQSTEHASYRLGGDASVGVSAILTVQGPSFGSPTSVLFKLDIGISVERALRLGETVRLLRDGLLLVAAVMPTVFGDILPADSDVTQCEVHFLAASQDGNSHVRPNELLQRVDFSPFGAATRGVGPSLGYAARVAGLLTERDAAELVVEGLEYMALASGFLDPRIGISSLRQELGIYVAP